MASRDESDQACPAQSDATATIATMAVVNPTGRMWVLGWRAVSIALSDYALIKGGRLAAVIALPELQVFHRVQADVLEFRFAHL